MSADIYLPDEYQKFYIKPYEHVPEENGVIRLGKVTRKLEKLIEKHNALLQYLALRFPPEPKPKPKSNKPWDAVYLLIQMRYMCDCVAPVVYQATTLTYRHPWCKTCNKTYVEKED